MKAIKISPVRIPEAAFRNSIGRFIRVNFSKLTDSNQIFWNDFVVIHYHLCKYSGQTIECKFLAPYDFQQWTRYLLHGPRTLSLEHYLLHGPIANGVQR